MAMACVLRFGLEQRCAQGRREDQRQRDRQRHGRNDGDGELPVDYAGRSTEKCHRQEHGGQHQRDGNQRAGDLAHRLLRGFAWAQPFLTHDALDVLDHDDRIIHQ